MGSAGAVPNTAIVIAVVRCLGCGREYFSAAVPRLSSPLPPCATCGAEAQVPFKPLEGRQVFCQACYRARKGTTVEATAGYMVNSRSLNAGSGTQAFETLRAYYGIVSVSHEF